MILRTYCLRCRKHINNIASKDVVMTNKVIWNKSRCGECLSDKSRFTVQEDSKGNQKKTKKTKT